MQSTHLMNMELQFFFNKIVYAETESSSASLISSTELFNTDFCFKSKTIFILIYFPSVLSHHRFLHFPSSFCVPYEVNRMVS